MNVTVKVCLPDDIYRFYKDASCCVAGYSPEMIIADALVAYARMLSNDLRIESEEDDNII